MLLPLVLLALPLVPVDHRRVVVLVVGGPVLELAQRPARVVVRNVVVVVGVEHGHMGVLVLDIARYALNGLLHDEPPRLPCAAGQAGSPPRPRCCRATSSRRAGNA